MKIYTGPNCAGCIELKRFLEEKNIPFEEANVSIPENRRVLMANNIISIPAVEFETGWCIGYEQIVAKVEAEYEI